MIIEKTHNVTTNLSNSIEFSVSDDSSKIFAFLSNFLYKEKERSVVTELSSNALDAHKLVGKEDVPISVTLPTSLVPMFTVRDFGPGLSEENVYTFLTKYGASSKGESNDFVGGFGIGSKSPAAVSDTWTIKSFHSGVVSEYLIHINDKGIPNINKLYSTNTTESGLEVSIPTKTINLWHDAAKVAYAHYEVMPHIKGASAIFNSVEFDSVFKDLVKFSSKSANGNRTYYNTMHVLMNRRAYVIDASKISGCSGIFNDNVHCYFPFDTSTLSVSLSREDMQYDSRTIEKIVNRINDIKSALVDEWKSTVSIKSDVFEYQQAASTFKTTYNLLGGFCRKLATSNADAFVNIVNYDNLSRYSVHLDKSYSTVQYATANIVKSLREGRSGIGTQNVAYNKINYSDDTKCINFNANSKEDIVFVLRDITNTPSRVKNAIANGIIANSVILDKQWFDLIPESFSKIHASSLDKVAVVRTKRDKVAAETFILNGKQLSRWILPDTTERVYIKIKNAKTIESIVGEFDSSFVSTFKNICDPTRIIFIKEGTDIPENCISAKTWVENKYAEIVEKSSDILDAVNLKEYRNISDYYCIGKILKSPTLFNDFDSSTAIAQIHAELNVLRNKKINTSLILLTDTLNTCERLLGKPYTNVTATNYIERLKIAYPLIKLLGNQYISDDMHEVVNYMRLVGK